MRAPKARALILEYFARSVYKQHMTSSFSNSRGGNSPRLPPSPGVPSVTIIFVSLQTAQFASDIGGVLGLWLGFSVITIFEFIELGLDALVLSCFKGIYLCRKQKQTAKTALPAQHQSPKQVNKTPKSAWATKRTTGVSDSSFSTSSTTSSRC